ncbi:MAG TPA: poly(R)-hydroxyalkanoic acid synthase subunit PhaE [Nitrososphaeraceae archaeon]|nr:poly(R)-hydroxyalkanoic acid synthase subunit PhaE [Nitrososphaeraceae archaeon]
MNRKEVSSTAKQDSQEDRMAQLINNWSELLKLPTIGPFHAFSQEINPYLQGMLSINQTLLKLQVDLNEYWSHMKNAYSNALKETTDRAPRTFNTKEDFENYRKVVIEAFEDAFTTLFTSEEFPRVYNKVSNDQMELLQSIQQLVENSLQALNLPTRSEINELAKDIHSLKRDIRNLKKRSQGTYFESDKSSSIE